VDRVGLVTLREELAADGRILTASAGRLDGFLASQLTGRLEASAFEIARCYNVIEQAALRIARSFQNHFEQQTGWHDALLRRMALDIPGVRPALFPLALKPALDGVRRFRPLVQDAYDVELREDRVVEAVRAVQLVAHEWPRLCGDFTRGVAEANGWPLPA